MSKARELANLGNAYSDGALSNRNLIINGAMQVAQRGTSNTVSSGGVFVVDRWKGQTDTAATIEQVADAPTGFSNSFKFTNTTAGNASNAYRELRYVVEAQDLINSGWDYTNSSATMTFSFWVKSSIAQTYAVLFRVDDTSTNKYYSKEFTVNTANTWEKKTISVIGDSGLTVNNDNGSGLSIFVLPYYGTGLAASSTDGFWGSSYNTSIKTFDDTWAATTNSTFYLTGVQLEVGDTATPFEHRSYGDELQRCRRYYFEPNYLTSGNRFAIWSGYVANGDSYNHTFFLPVEMRTNPTYTATKGDSASFGSSIVAGNLSDHSGRVYVTANANDANAFYYYTITADAEL